MIKIHVNENRLLRFVMTMDVLLEVSVPPFTLTHD